MQHHKNIINLRQRLHASPELSNLEYKTAETIKNFVAQYHPTEIIEGIGGSGLVVIYAFANPGKTIAIRCELDALPIQEANDFPYASAVAGVSHKCGHDGHMCMVAGLAPLLNEGIIDKGKIILLFQPAEETGEGAARMLQDPAFSAFTIDYVFALHNVPKVPKHQILIMNHGFSAEVISLAVSFMGVESHASEPENGINPALCISDIISDLESLNNNHPEDQHFRVLTAVHIHMGDKAYGISPARGELHYTIRTWSKENMDALKNRIVDIINTQCKAHHLTSTVQWLEYFPASVNDPDANNYIRQAATDHQLTVVDHSYPFRFGEDFGWFSRQYKSAMFGLGAGKNTPALHHADYDFPDDIISTGIQMFSSIILNVLNE